MTAEERIIDAGYQNIIIFSDYGYDEALIGISEDERAIYDYDLMIECLVNEGMTQEEAVDWIDYNTIRALPYIKEKAPIIMYRV